MSGVNIRHIGLVVANLERALDFYCGKLGFKIRSRQLEKGNYISTMLGYENAQVETVKLYLEETGSLLELLYFQTPTSEISETKTLNSLGITHFALGVSNLDDLYKKLLPYGIKFVSEPTVT